MRRKKFIWLILPDHPEESQAEAHGRSYEEHCFLVIGLLTGPCTPNFLKKLQVRVPQHGATCSRLDPPAFVSSNKTGPQMPG